ncbi:peptidoglycan recognition protein 1-like [Macrosteles quadrilineatus]|uniref:peptidoglycan recognition protein 1-like n=1 Tax=Macrosteles quadrilineatus TaxID=74068 RepID=UPI0023E1968D|nr:peptidoglycan recognition protein 1-like [Macrosteles quadrilineatus]
MSTTQDKPLQEEPECLKICPEIIPRREWRPRKPKKAHTQQDRAWYPVLFRSSNSYECKTKDECLKNVKWMQTYHMEIHKLDDIGFSFLIGEDGNVYEGRGWGVENHRMGGYVGIAYIGYYCWDADKQPTKAMKRAAFRLVLCGIQKGFIKSPFKKGIKTMKSGLPEPEMWDKYMFQAEDEF